MYFIKLTLLLLALLANVSFGGVLEPGNIDVSLADIKLGSAIQEVNQKYKGIYKHKLMMGEYLYEACNQKDLIVTTLTEEPWSPGFITRIQIRQEKDVSVCRDSTGALPDFSIPPQTIRGLKIGQTEHETLKLYGSPREKCKIGNDRIVWRYLQASGASLNHLLFAIVFEKDKIVSLSINGEIKGKENPFYKNGVSRSTKCDPAL